MASTAVITQPTYLPWLGYFEQMRRADVFIFLDSVQFERRSWQCRNRIRTSRGDTFWLTVPVKSHSRDTLIHDIVISPTERGWADNHLKALAVHLAKAPYVREMLAIVEPILGDPPVLLAELNIALIRAMAAHLGLHPRFLRSSELSVPGTSADLIVNLIESVGATDYYSAAGSAAYLESARPRFEQAGIRYRYQTWEHPTYAQHGAPFTSHLAIVDPLSWTGRLGVRRMIGLEPFHHD
jgi:hypothetical protein